MKKTTVSSIEAKATIGNRPVYDISLWEVKNGKETKLSNLNGKTISIAIPYTPAKNEQTGNLYAVSVDGNGKPQWITKSNYDADQKAVIFELTQPGVYGVGYDAKMPAFTDIENHWAKDNILFVVSRGLLNGTSETTFSHNTGMTRGTVSYTHLDVYKRQGHANATDGPAIKMSRTVYNYDEQVEISTESSVLTSKVENLDTWQSFSQGTDWCYNYITERCV